MVRWQSNGCAVAFFGWCVVVRAGIKAPVTSYVCVCSLYKCVQVSIDGTCYFSTTDQQVRKIGFMNTLGTKSTYSYVDIDNASASPENRQADLL